MTEVNYRDAVSGEFVTKEYALAHPDTTVAEIVPDEDDNDTEEYDTLGGDD
jgi:hypothetical protein